MKHIERHDEVKQFLLAHIATHEQLQSLLLLHRAGGQWQSLEDVSAALGLFPDSTEEALSHLETEGLIGSDEKLGFRYLPSSPELAAGANQLAQAYEQEWLTVLELMGDNSIHRIRSAALKAFSDAFLLTRKKQDG